MKDIDYPILIEGLTKEGVTLAEISKETGINASYLSSIKNELMAAPEAWQSAAKLIDMHFRFRPRNYIPLYGNHNEI